MRRILIATIFVVSIVIVHAQHAHEHLVRFIEGQKSVDVIAAAKIAISHTEEKTSASWIRPLADLKPVRVYRDRVNIAVVVGEDRSGERGVYVVIPESSYLPASNEEWSFIHVKDEIYVYERKRHNQSPQRNASATSPSTIESTVRHG